MLQFGLFRRLHLSFIGSYLFSLLSAAFGDGGDLWAQKSERSLFTRRSLFTKR